MAEEKAKYEEIADCIIAEVKKGKLRPGSRIYSEHELSSMFQVSRQTARHAVSVLENKGIVRRIRGSGTYVNGKEPGGGTQSGRTMRIAVMTSYVDEYIFPGMLKEMEGRLSREGYALQIAFTYNLVEKERMILKRFLKDGTVDGIIAEPTQSGLPNPNLDLYRELQKKIPVLFLNSFYPGLESVHVSMDDYLAGRMATEHLLQCGHRRIAGIFKSDDGQGHKRYAGYMDALMAWEMKVKSERIAWIDTCELKEMKVDAARYLRRIAGCTACVCYNDEVANHLVGICKEAGIRIPEDLSIVGIDNSDLAGRCEIPLTSAQNPVKELAGTAAAKLLEMLEGIKKEESVELKPKLVIRKSVRILTEPEELGVPTVSKVDRKIK